MKSAKKGHRSPKLIDLRPDMHMVISRFSIIIPDESTQRGATSINYWNNAILTPPIDGT